VFFYIKNRFRVLHQRQLVGFVKNCGEIEKHFPPAVINQHYKIPRHVPLKFGKRTWVLSTLISVYTTYLSDFFSVLMPFTGPEVCTRPNQ
jgi:hypothetical protein